MAKRYEYNRINAFTKGLVTLSTLAYGIAFLAFIGFLAINYLSFLEHLIDFSELEFVVSKVFLRLDAFLIIGAVLSFFGLLWSASLPKALSNQKGGFRALLLAVLSAVLIAFFVIIKAKDLTLSYILNYTFGGILVVGIIGLLLGIFALVIRIKNRRQMERKLRKFERNYMKFEKYNR
ncbi:MAG: hypothetical protein IJD50_03080 [Clostridia bacterium]|nr:hypothetical protein [Clostridia bacterium]